MNRFSYLLDKIERAEFSSAPFRHIEVNNFLLEADFEELISSEEIRLGSCCNDEVLFERLLEQGYSIVPFPGATTNMKSYIRWHSSRKFNNADHNACESSGVVLRLTESRTRIVGELKEFIESDEFNVCLAEKFGLSFDVCRKDSGIQKYLDGYEISPHPDLRRKALTFMVNLNPNPASESQDHHTHYLKFRDSFKYVSEYWHGNPSVERCWVPWGWCETVKRQHQNNSLVAFSPSFDTLHAVRASYNHLEFQRTQLYGNLWYGSGFPKPESRLEWEDFVLGSNRPKRNTPRIVLKRARRLISSLAGDELFVDRTRQKNHGD